VSFLDLLFAAAKQQTNNMTIIHTNKNLLHTQ
jgi:hypothetical protein